MRLCQIRLRAMNAPLPSRFFQLLYRGSEDYPSSTQLIGAIIAIAVEYGLPAEILYTKFLQNEKYPAASDIIKRGRVRKRSVLLWYERSAAGQRLEWDRNQYLVDIAALKETACGIWLPRYSFESTSIDGQILRRVYLAHLHAAQTNPGIDYPASVRFIAEQAGCTVGSSRKATDFLLANNIITRREPYGQRSLLTCNRYRLNTDYRCLESIICAAEMSPVAALADSPLWRVGSGLRFDVYEFIAANPYTTIQQIIDSLGLSRRTVSYQVSRLIAQKLVQLDGRTLSITDDPERRISKAEIRTGMRDRAIKQQQAHDKHRAQQAFNILSLRGAHETVLRYRIVRRLYSILSSASHSIASLAYVDHRFVDISTGEVLTPLRL